MTKRQIHSRLIAQGMTFRSWALRHGYNPRTVLLVVDRWAGRDSQPYGRTAFRILRDLSRDIGDEIVPGIAKDAA